VALVLAGAAAALALLGGRLVPAAASVVALALVAYRVAVPPDFGFGFDGLAVPVERRWGCWVALGAALLAAALAAARARPRRDPAPEDPEGGTPP
jgi:hypothetical protein